MCVCVFPVVFSLPEMVNKVEYKSPDFRSRRPLLHPVTVNYDLDLMTFELNQNIFEMKQRASIIGQISFNSKVVVWIVDTHTHTHTPDRYCSTYTTEVLRSRPTFTTLVAVIPRT